MIIAAQRGFISTIKCLLDYGADPNLRDDLQATAIMRAAAEGQLESVRTLVEYGGADWTCATMGGLNARKWAQSKHNDDVVELLDEFDSLWADDGES